METMSDLIDREALKKATKELYNETLDAIVRFGIEKVYELINNAPTVESKQGECENCKHFKESRCENSPDGYCLIMRATQEGNLETQVPKDYYCSWYEKGGAK